MRRGQRPVSLPERVTVRNPPLEWLGTCSPVLLPREHLARLYPACREDAMRVLDSRYHGLRGTLCRRGSLCPRGACDSSELIEIGGVLESLRLQHRPP